jgi:hypothetical protein
MSARIEGKRMTCHNTPQLSGMDSANHCAAFPGLSALSTTTIYETTFPTVACVFVAAGTCLLSLKAMPRL